MLFACTVEILVKSTTPSPKLEPVISVLQMGRVEKGNQLAVLILFCLAANHWTLNDGLIRAISVVAGASQEADQASAEFVHDEASSAAARFT